MENQNAKSENEAHEEVKHEEGKPEVVSESAAQTSPHLDEDDGWILDDFTDAEGRFLLTTSSLDPNYEPGDDVIKP